MFRFISVLRVRGTRLVGTWIVWSGASSTLAGPTCATALPGRPEADGSWLLCRGRRCRDLRLEGSVTITARAIFDSGSVVAVLGSDSRSLRVVDTTPPVNETPAGSPSIPYCFGDQDACDDAVASTGLWNAYVSICGQIPPGSVFAIGNGASIKCPE